MTSPDPHVFVLFGANGDLAKRKLLPGVKKLHAAGLLPDAMRVIGTGRHDPDDDWAEPLDGAVQATFVKSSADDAADLAAAVRDAREELGEDARVLLYLSVPPSAMLDMVGMLGREGLHERARLVMEKPFGHDVASARELNAAIHEHFDEEQVFRIDHFLGKEAAQDIFALRFANGLFEPIWNAEHVAAVLIDIPEDLGLEGRDDFYAETGALRDMVVTHLFQLLGLVAMERPEALEPGPLHDAKHSAFADLRIDEVVFGQFEGYDREADTFAAARAFVDNERWRGIPFLLRTGKEMAEGRRLVSVVLKAGDEVRFELTDDPKLAVRVCVKRPGPQNELIRADLTLDVERATDESGLEAYERLLHDVMQGDQLLFTRADEIERLWEVVAPVLDDPPEPHPYAKGSWGPEAAVELAEPVGWRLPD